ncbi:autophagy-related protein 9A-like [Teleopsis dalmanni]|uniref:autophagy-related protein 9A-like n=1 Tax=Teleopsis dalmanni TaxID=139649 RepID=UPI0018CE386C|nr:autophagy-related protein 9A-like [Teleopsis dalmanni]
MRTWSNYGRLYLRHFNELDHELDARLNRAYEYANRYLSSFSSPLIAVFAKNILFLSGGLLVLILALGIYEEFVFQVEHVLTLITVLSAVGIICRNLIPDENLVWCPEQLMTAILAHIHYLPFHWKNNAHTIKVRKEFETLFQLKAIYLLNEICSPLITPFILIFVLKPKALEIVKFFKSFTVSVKGVGNVCSFAQMDIRKHGNPDWQPCNLDANAENINEIMHPLSNGKTELSLLRFTLTNPEWPLPSAAKYFVKSIRANALQELIKAKETCTNNNSNPITRSLLSFGTIANEYSSIANSVLDAHNVHEIGLRKSTNSTICSKAPKYSCYKNNEEIQESDFEQMLQQNLSDLTQERIENISISAVPGMKKMRVYKTEGRLEGPSDTLLNSIHGKNLHINSVNIMIADMCLSALYLHELNKRNVSTYYYN